MQGFDNKFGLILGCLMAGKIREKIYKKP